jgi:hypothetical protein
MRKLTTQEKLRRGTLQPWREPPRAVPPDPDPSEFESWWSGIADPIARREGARFFEHCIIGPDTAANRRAFEQWALAVARVERMPRTIETHPAELGLAHTAAANLLAALPYRRR